MSLYNPDFATFTEKIHSPKIGPRSRPVTISFLSLAMMLRTSSGILAEIVSHKQQEVADLHRRAGALEREAHERKAPLRPFAESLRGPGPNIIAEIKKASPSKGLLQADFHPALIAHQYELGGAACLSVLTDNEFFQGSWHDLEAARAATQLPVLRKDFTIDRIQIWEAAAHGADAILLIAAILDVAELRNLRELAQSFGLAALVEVHDHDELNKAIDSGAAIIGVNNRNLDTFEVSLDTSLRLSYLMPVGVTRVTESGIFTRADIETLSAAGFHTFLIGESLMKSADPAGALQALVSHV
jgi:indole-3-glycerol phosphate synthase